MPIKIKARPPPTINGHKGSGAGGIFPAEWDLLCDSNLEIDCESLNDFDSDIEFDSEPEIRPKFECVLKADCVWASDWNGDSLGESDSEFEVGESENE